MREKMDNGKKKKFHRWYWLEKRRRKKHLNISSGSVVQSTPPPLCWSSTSLICRLISQHNFTKVCIESKWKWSTSTTSSSTILINNNKQILFHPRISSSTQVILADRPLPFSGKHYWEIYMPAIYGTSIMFGIASKMIN